MMDLRKEKIKNSPVMNLPPVTADYVKWSNPFTETNFKS